MGRNTREQKRNRQSNTGGVYPDALETAIALKRLFYQFERNALKEVDTEPLIMVTLFLWLTQRLNHLERLDGEEQVQLSIPNFKRISGTEDCEENAFRNTRHGQYSWAEYALAYDTDQGIQYLWQPIPTALNHLFQPFIAAQKIGHQWLDAEQKQRLSVVLTRKWTTPSHLTALHFSTKQTFFNYFSQCSRVDTELSSITKSILLPSNLLHHHRNAKDYQRQDSDHIRYQIFHAQHRHLERVLTIYRQQHWNESISQTNQKQLKLIDKNSSPKIPELFTRENKISQRTLSIKNRTQTYNNDAPIVLGSQRQVSQSDIVRLFRMIEGEINQSRPQPGSALSVYIKFYNLCTYHIALLFILLTSTRPTHAISIERQRCFSQLATIYDKGQWREILLCEFLEKQIKHYLKFQHNLAQRLPNIASEPSPYLWFLIDEKQCATPLNHRSLQQFLTPFSPNIEPYVLRHAFAQAALTSSPFNKLTTQQIDRLMGHSEQGEHFGQDHWLPETYDTLMRFLNSLPPHFGLKEVEYV
ncbi:hypothetical protein [Parashewanella tropica]|uniref:hypothetical protein n=1 Tax=Parashewanella tropica TaxID=2547970 RepID=UPI00105A271E|nr:hypothetical protein [Parashewanella tropica]